MPVWICPQPVTQSFNTFILFRAAPTTLADFAAAELARREDRSNLELMDLSGHPRWVEHRMARENTIATEGFRSPSDGLGSPWVEDTKLTGGQYNLLLALYYVMFEAFGPVMTVFTKVGSAKVSLPCMMLTFGIASACTSVVKNFGQLLTCRIFVAVIASAFGGLLAYGMFQIRPSSSSNLFVWPYLFILKGCLTCIVAIVAYFILPQDIAHAYFLTPTEKDMAEMRIRLETMESRNDRFMWSEAVAEFKKVHGCARVLIALSVGIWPNVSANFLAIMTVRLGYSVTKTNLSAPSVPPTHDDEEQALALALVLHQEISQ
ncbi:uncharacterized protein Z519_06215 [Cladophialophora bantiana CBS 173.52]|uniref:Major facilitator superfamily (MFS) profile domain-containing protein n=1 Tax=Cladophialophora bantiana (strain ATCC 10958 / CBS 173.52 / CDC B-1940 / NIH 8579) TaxID=1442370 RepID=A0A0D2HRZ0_CLAB1|nr:uncharacterized protein Z519_06215 [Cladophialophora bantiana CBS 173.52]KIW93610.1 hypothetical protein Z519_06215 [Cladophialophora bantiana CBS 173.52]